MRIKREGGMKEGLRGKGSEGEGMAERVGGFLNPTYFQ